MIAARSPSTNRPYGASRVCRVWELARSGLYAARKRRESTGQERGKPGPKTELSDVEVLVNTRNRTISQTTVHSIRCATRTNCRFGLS